MTRTDSELVALVATGDLSAYGELYRRHWSAALQQASRLTPRHAEADDLVAGAFMKCCLPSGEDIGPTGSGRIC